MLHMGTFSSVYSFPINKTYMYLIIIIFMYHTFSSEQSEHSLNLEPSIFLHMCIIKIQLFKGVCCFAAVVYLFSKIIITYSCLKFVLFCINSYLT